MREIPEELVALVGAALVEPKLAGFVCDALHKDEFPKKNALETVAIAVAYNHIHGEPGGPFAVLETLESWDEVERTGGLEFIGALVARRPALTDMLAALQARLDRLPPVLEEPIVLAAAEILGAERVTYEPSLYCESQDGTAVGIA